MRPTAYLERTITLVTLISAVSASACLPSKGNLGEYTGGETGTSDTDPSDSESGTDSGTTASPTAGDETEGTTTASTTASDTESDTEGDTTGDVDLMPFDPGCESPPPVSPLQLGDFAFDPPLQGDGFAATCQVQDVETLPNAVSIGFDCGEQHVQLALQIDQPFGTLVAPGDTLVLDYRAVFSFSTDEWFTLRRPDPDATLVLAGMRAQQLAPPDAADFFAPLSLTAHEGLCAVPTNCEDFSEKIAVEFAHDGESVHVFELYSAELGVSPPYRVALNIARKSHPVQSLGNGEFCEIFDAPPYYFDSVIHILD